MKNQQEYLVIDERFSILEKSRSVSRFLDSSSQLKLGDDLRFSLPELVGLETILKEIFAKQKSSFELKDICRCRGSSGNTFYFNLYFTSASINKIIILLEDVTEQNFAYQKKIQAANECRLLCNQISANRESLEQIVQTTKEVLLIVDRCGKIKNFSSIILELFGYSSPELFNRNVEILFANSQLKFADLIRQKDLEIVCQTKNKAKLNVTFSISSICSQADHNNDFILVGRQVNLK